MPVQTISVIIPVYKQQKELDACLAALSRQQESIEIIVVDNAEQPSLSVPGNVTLLHEPQPGAYAARNAGIQRATGDILCFLDADTTPAAHWSSAVREYFQQHPQIDFAGGQIKMKPQGDAPATWIEWYDCVSYAQQEHYIRAYGFSGGGNLLVRRATIERVGVFDASLRSGGDIAWCLRARDNGMKIGYAADAKVDHAARSSFRSWSHRIRRFAGGARQSKNVHQSFMGAVKDIPATLLRLPGIWRNPKLQNNRERCMFAAILLLQRIVFTTEWARVAMGGTPVR